MTKQRSFSAGEARLLLRRARTGTLASLNREDGIPYASLVNVATDVEGHPLILVGDRFQCQLGKNPSTLMRGRVPVRPWECLLADPWRVYIHGQQYLFLVRS